MKSVLYFLWEFFWFMGERGGYYCRNFVHWFQMRTTRIGPSRTNDMKRGLWNKKKKNENFASRVCGYSVFCRLNVVPVRMVSTWHWLGREMLTVAALREIEYVSWFMKSSSTSHVLLAMPYAHSKRLFLTPLFHSSPHPPLNWGSITCTLVLVSLWFFSFTFVSGCKKFNCKKV